MLHDTLKTHERGEGSAAGNSRLLIRTAKLGAIRSGINDHLSLHFMAELNDSEGALERRNISRKVWACNLFLDDLSTGEARIAMVSLLRGFAMRDSDVLKQRWMSRPMRDGVGWPRNLMNTLRAAARTLLEDGRASKCLLKDELRGAHQAIQEMSLSGAQDVEHHERAHWGRQGLAAGNG